MPSDAHLRQLLLKKFLGHIGCSGEKPSDAQRTLFIVRREMNRNTSCVHWKRTVGYTKRPMQRLLLHSVQKIEVPL
jgi:hypothetical protein